MCAESTKPLSQLSDAELLHDLNSLVARDRAITAALLAHLAEVDARRLYVAAGYPSMYAYCVGELKFSDDEAYKRIQVARAGREVPALLAALSEGHVHLTAARMLAPHLTAKNADELLRAAAQRSKEELERWILRRFAEDRPSIVFPAASSQSMIDPQLVPGPVEFAGEFVDFGAGTGAGGSAEASANGVVATAPIATAPTPEPERILLRVALDRATHEKLVYARQLLGHAVPTGDVGRVLDRALDLLIARLEKQKFAATDRPRKDVATADAPSHKRYVPAAVKRAVWERDGGRCTYVAPSGHRCEARGRLEYDHVDPVALGGVSTVDGLRLRCHAHNQYEAEQTFGAEFMNAKRAAARRDAEERRQAADGDGRGEQVNGASP